MRARKRSGALTAGAAVLVLVLAGCGGAGVDAAAIAGKVDAVDVLRTDAEHAEGARAYPLRVGDSLVFAFDGAVTPAWTMRGVRWPLRLDAYDDRGRVIESALMLPCRGFCADHHPTVESAVWVETRVPRPKRLDVEGLIDPETGRPLPD